MHLSVLLRILRWHFKAAGLGEVLVFVGYLRRTNDTEAKTLGVPRGGPMNCAAVIYDGKIQTSYAKHHLPNYGVFDEYRYFVPGNDSVLIRAFGVDIAVAICEDFVARRWSGFAS